MSIAQRIFKNTFSNFSINIWTTLVNMAVLPFLIRQMGMDDLGIYYLVFAVLNFFTWDFGMNAALVKYTAQASSRKDWNWLNNTATISGLFFMLVSLVVCLLLVITGIYGIDWFQIPVGKTPLGRKLFFFTAGFLFFSSLFRIYPLMLQGLQEYVLLNRIKIVTSLLRIIGLITIVIVQLDVLWLAYLHFLIEGVQLLVTALVVKRKIPTLRLSLGEVRREEVKSVFNFSFYMMIGTLSATLIRKTDRIILGIFLPISAITQYHIVSRADNIIRRFGGSLAVALFPAFTQLNEAKNEQRIRDVVFSGTKIILAFFVPVTLILVVLAENFLTAWVGAENAHLAGAMQIFILYFAISPVQTVLWQLAKSREKISRIVYWQLAGALLNLLLSIILIQSYGLTGVVAATTIQYLLILWPIMKILMHDHGIAFFDMIKSSVLPVYPFAILVAFLGYLISGFQIDSILYFFLKCALLMALFVLLFYLFGVNDIEKDILQRQLRKMLGRPVAGKATT